MKLWKLKWKASQTLVPYYYKLVLSWEVTLQFVSRSAPTDGRVWLAQGQLVGQLVAARAVRQGLEHLFAISCSRKNLHVVRWRRMLTNGANGLVSDANAVVTVRTATQWNCQQRKPRAGDAESRRRKPVKLGASGAQSDEHLQVPSTEDAIQPIMHLLHPVSVWKEPRGRTISRRIREAELLSIYLSTECSETGNCRYFVYSEAENQHFAPYAKILCL